MLVERYYTIIYVCVTTFIVFFKAIKVKQHSDQKFIAFLKKNKIEGEQPAKLLGFYI